jgi:Xaa-Pro aminopeptidase
MPKIIEIAVHEFHELSDKAKEKARAWFREGVGDWDWYEFIYEQIAAAYCRTIAGLA